jgi:hypothetical protein
MSFNGGGQRWALQTQSLGWRKLDLFASVETPRWGDANLGRLPTILTN